jgi:hypothetical protein
MTTNIKLYFKTRSKIDETTFSIAINGALQEYSIVDSIIIINADLTFGFHTLSIIPTADIDKSDINIEFTSGLIDGADIRQTLYLSYSIRDQQRKNNTVINHYYPNWYLPFVNPASWWLAECSRNMSSGTYGKNLEDRLNVFYPESIIVGNDYPRVVRDFFEYNFGFHTCAKSASSRPFHNEDIPYVVLPNFEYNESALLKEFTDNFNLFSDSRYIPAQHNYKLDSHGEKAVPWQIIRASLGNDKTDTPFPHFNELVSQLEADGIKIGMSFIAVLHPNSYVTPHIDDYHTQADFMSDQIGCCKIWIPVGWKDGNYFKFDRVGLIDYKKGAHLINTNKFTHSSINSSDTVRFTVGFNCKFPDNFTKYL